MTVYYVEAVSVADGWKGRVYTYDSTGNKPIVVQLCPDVKSSKEEAIEDASDWCDMHDMRYEIDFGD